jgi:hypothetical protein
MWTRHGPCLLEAVDDYYIPGKQLVRSKNTRSSLRVTYVGCLGAVRIPLLRLYLTYLVYWMNVSLLFWYSGYVS